MATGSAQLDALAREIEHVPAAAVAELERWFVSRSERVGGKMRWYGHVIQLSSKAVDQRTKGGTVAITMIGTPAAAWSIKSNGRRGGYEVRPRRKHALKLSGAVSGLVFSHVVVHTGVSGDHRWDHLVDEADGQLLSITTTAVEQALR